MSTSRQLAAIMFTDIVGYTALMGKDSAKALELVRISKEIQKRLVEKHNGKWLKEMGDGAMAQFDTALDAVNCAVEIQKTARAEFDGKIRIGIHLGDVTIQDEDVYGDGVNVASRLESIADPGGIYISESIEKAVQGQTDVQAKYLGEVKLKNVAYGVRTYAVQGVGLPVPEVQDQKELSGHFWAEVQRRGVFRAGISYLVVGLLFVLLWNQAQGWDIVLPQWSQTLLFVVLIIGFPIAMYLAWNYERSPEGFVQTSSQQSWQNPYKSSQRKPLTSNVIIAGMALIIVGMYLYPRLFSGDRSQQSTESTLEPAVIDKSIAVLPFADMSPGKDQEYFSYGMMDEILNHLFKIGDLKVTSRTSVMRYKGTTKSINEIAQELGVANILEGSVRKAGDRVRITVQLIDCMTDQHRWAEIYDRELIDVFAIQSEVAQQIAGHLRTEISPEVKLRMESKLTENATVLDLYFKAKSMTWSAPLKAEELLHTVILLDSNFVPAYAELGGIWLRRGKFDGYLNSKEVIDNATPFLNKALELNYDYPATHTYLGYLKLFYDWDFEAAMEEYHIAYQLNPADINVMPRKVFMMQGNFEEALARSEIGYSVDPNAFLVSKGTSHFFMNQREDAMEICQAALQSHSGDVFGTGRLCLYLHLYDDVIGVTEEWLKNNQPLRIPVALGNLAIAYYHTNQEDRIDLLLAELKQKSEQSTVGSPSYFIAMIYAQMGEIDLAFEWLEKAYQDHEVEMVWLKVEPPFEPLRNDPRWQVMLDKVGFPE